MAEWTRVLRWMQRRVAPLDDAMRVDRWLRQHFPHVPPSFLQKELRQRKIRVAAADGAPSTPVKPNYLLRSGATVAIDAFAFNRGFTSPRGDVAEPEVSPEVLKIADALVRRLVYQDDNYLVLNKPHGLAVQDGTALKDSLATYLPALGAALKSEPPRLVHRLDKNTSGLLVLARHRLAAARFSTLLQDGAVKKTYSALVKPLARAPHIPEKGDIALPIDGKPARTLFRRLKNLGNGTLWLEMQPVTGRKHQLRIHCSLGLQAPIVGDRRHSPSHDVRRHERLFLHAERLSFPDPFRPRSTIYVTCEMDAASPNTAVVETKKPLER